MTEGVLHPEILEDIVIEETGRETMEEDAVMITGEGGLQVLITGEGVRVAARGGGRDTSQEVCGTNGKMYSAANIFFSLFLYRIH